MSRKRKQFEALKSRLKSLYFKKGLVVSKRNVKFNLVAEKPEQSINLAPVEKLKTKETIWMKNPDAPSKLSSVKLSGKKASSIERIAAGPRTLYIEKPTETKEVVNTVVKNNTEVQTPGGPKESKQSTKTTKSANVKNSSVNIEKSYKFSNINLETPITNVETVKQENTNVINNSKKYTKNYIVNTTRNYKTAPPNINMVKNNLEIKYIESPDELKKINVTNIANSKSLDVRKIYIPSKTELVKLRETVLRETPKKSFEPEKSSVINNIRESVTNNTINRNTTQNINAQTKTAVYALPAFADGTNGPLKSDTIGKMHRGEVVLTQKETKMLTGQNSGILKNESSVDLKPKSQPMVDNSEPDLVSANLKKPESKETLPQEKTDDNIINEFGHILRGQRAANNPVIDQAAISIPKNVGKALHYDQDLKNKSLPVWRANVG
jgi:hypothetical protein